MFRYPTSCPIPSAETDQGDSAVQAVRTVDANVRDREAIMLVAKADGDTAARHGRTTTEERIFEERDNAAYRYHDE